MRLVGLTGGIGSGKSTVSDQLQDNGAVIIDADAIVRELQQPGEPVFTAMVERWGKDVVAHDATLNRAAVAAIVFNDADELKALEAIVHPVLRTEIKRRIAEQRSTENVVVLDMALLTEKANPYDVSEIIVVDLAPHTAAERLVRFRGFSADDAAKRIAAQTSREERLALATHVIDNNGNLTALKEQVDALWQNLTQPQNDALP